jgi:signal transduction histidine kinase
MRFEQSEFHNQLVRGLTHRMNNILSLCQGYIGMLIDDKNLDRDTRDGLIRIRESADAASSLMDRTKALATPSSTVWRQVAPDDFFKSLMPAFQAYASRGVTFQVSCEPGMPDLYADTARLRVALKEIVKNACEASPANGIVKITVKRHPHPFSPRGRQLGPALIDWTAITVTDSGKGIPPSLSAKVFQPFFSTKRNDSAVGLGLSVALGLVQQLGGAIRLQSKPGRTAVKVLLPGRNDQSN